MGAEWGPWGGHKIGWVWVGWGWIGGGLGLVHCMLGGFTIHGVGLMGLGQSELDIRCV